MYYLLILILFSLSSCENVKTSHKLFLPDGFKHQVYIDRLEKNLDTWQSVKMEIFM